ncbi:MAG: putative zinc-binding protein [Oligoflexia bacterium]|nr:putative zinc-binding protein [Oligoflexia bacterium]
MENDNRKFKKPLIYSCSGCSSAAQLANCVAIRLDREGLAEMSCIAGVGGDVTSLVDIAKSGREIIALDGCPLQCTANCLKRHGVVPKYHHVLSQYGIKKIQHGDFSLEQAEEVYKIVLTKIA